MEGLPVFSTLYSGFSFGEARQCRGTIHVSWIMLLSVFCCTKWAVTTSLYIACYLSTLLRSTLPQRAIKSPSKLFIQRRGTQTGKMGKIRCLFIHSWLLPEAERGEQPLPSFLMLQLLPRVLKGQLTLLCYSCDKLITISST